MLNKNTDFAIVGHNFFSYLMGAALSSKNKKVLILDDDRFNHGNLFTDSLTVFDLEILKKWGEKYDIPPLKKMEEYIQFSPISFVVAKKEVILGDNPSRNYTELARKFPEFFKFNNSIENLDQSLFQVANLVADAFYSNRNIIKLSKVLENSKQLEIMKKFEEFYLLFFEKNKWDIVLQSELNAFVTLGRGFFHNRLGINGSRSELMHLFFSLLSPHFQFDHERLNADLLIHYKSIGGEFKKLNLFALKFHRGIVSSLELESYEGNISPGNLLFIGGEPSALPIRLKEKVTVYNSLEVKLLLENKISPNLVGKKMIFSSPLKTGTNWPFWEACFYEDSIIFNVVMLKQQGIKENFIAKKVLSYIHEDLKFLYPEYDFKVRESDFKFTLDVLIEDNNLSAHLKENPKISLRPVPVYSKTSPFSFFKLKNVSYLGPYSGNTHGVFSSLMLLEKRMDSLL